jgi:hypothetical protein
LEPIFWVYANENNAAFIVESADKLLYQPKETTKYTQYYLNKRLFGWGIRGVIETVNNFV